MLFICQFPLHSTSVLVLQLSVYLPMYLNSSLFYSVSHAVKLHFVDITLAQSLSFPPSVNQSASVPCSLNLSTLPLFYHLVSHSCSLPSPHLHVTLVRHIVVQASTCFISATMSTYTPGGPVLFPTTVGLGYLALSESNHQIFYYSLFNKSCSVPSNWSLLNEISDTCPYWFFVLCFYLIGIVLILVLSQASYC